MDFAEEIKAIRSENNLTQEEMAKKLNVTRQSVSNWENNRNLPDIEMLISISKEFKLSLDQLILGENENMNNMTEKLIKDTSEAKMLKNNTISICVGAVLLVIGILLLILKAMSVEYIDADGILHENFFLIPSGFLFMFGGFMTFMITGIRNIVHLFQNKNQKSYKLSISGISFGTVLLLFGGFLMLLSANSGAITAIPGAVVSILSVVLLIVSIVYALIIGRKNQS